MAEIHRFDWDWKSAEREFEQGTRMNPSDTTGLLLYINFLVSMRRFDEAIDIAIRAIEIDPLSPAIHNELAQSLFFAGRENDAIERYQKSLQLDPDFYWTQWSLAEIYIRVKEPDKALSLLAKLRLKVETMPPSIIGLVGGSYGRVGRQDDARSILSYLLGRRESEYIPASAIAYLYAGLKDDEEALAWLQKAYEERNIQLTWLNVDYLWDDLRGDPRFQDIIARMNFPDAGG